MNTKCTPLLVWKILAVLLSTVLSLVAGQHGDFTYTDNGTSITISDLLKDALKDTLKDATQKQIPGSGAGLFRRQEQAPRDTDRRILRKT